MQTRRILAALGSAALLATALRCEVLAAVGAFALVPWLAALRRAGIASALASAALLGGGAGALAAPWLPDALAALGASRAASRAGALAAYALIAVPELAALALLARATERAATPARALTLGAAVFAIERARSLAAAGVPFGLLGHSQIGLPGVAQLALAGGVPLVSAPLVALQIAVADALHARPGAARAALALRAAWRAPPDPGTATPLDVA